MRWTAFDPPMPAIFSKINDQNFSFQSFFLLKEEVRSEIPIQSHLYYTYTTLIHCFCAFKPQIKSFSSSLSYNIKYQLFPKPTMWANVTHPVFEYLLRVASVFSQRVFGTYEEPTDVINNLNILNIRREHCPRYWPNIEVQGAFGPVDSSLFSNKHFFIVLL